MHTLYTMNKTFTVRISRLDWTALASDPLNRTGLDQDHRLTDLDWTGFFQMNPFHTLLGGHDPIGRESTEPEGLVISRLLYYKGLFSREIGPPP